VVVVVAVVGVVRAVVVVARTATAQRSHRGQQLSPTAE
jgi:Tfp pilus assembly protein PilE